MNLLDAVLWLPLAGFVLLLLIPRERVRAIRQFALGITTATFLLSLALLVGFDRTSAAFQYETNLPWISSPEIRYHIGIDGISLWLVLLTTLLSPIGVLISWQHIDRRVKEFFALFLAMEFGLIGVFVALDLFLFYVFWEVSLVPMYFLIGVWGHERRIYAAVKFFIFTMTGSVLMLAGIIYLYIRAGTFDYPALIEMMMNGSLMLDRMEQNLLFAGFFAAFAIKVPLFPLHTWLPDAHVEAPTAGSVMLASVMLKMGCYGLLRFCLPMFPAAARGAAPWIVMLAIAGILYGALVAMVQPNMKKLVAYTSVSHLGFVVLGLFTFTELGTNGAVYQMLNHGISTGALFALVGFLYERRHSLEIEDYGGVATPAPVLATMFLITSLASMGLPVLNNFVGEYLVLQGAAQVNFRWAVFAAIGVILAACYMLWMYQRVFYGEARKDFSMRDANLREWAVMSPLIILMVWMGTYTQTFLPPITASSAAILEQTKVNVEFHVERQMPRQELANAR
ncbi:MAG TPA: NADH-quinone oxidoreductase subunit M [Bryobacteraceae bacterium]|nr:NADH-quinone oxidoreductase subunit M [Bryobacteraceae bacterium]